MPPDPATSPRILVLTSTYPRWAGDTLPRFVHDLAAEQVRQGARVRVIAPYSKGSQEREVLDGVEVVRYRYWFTERDLLSDVAKVPAIRRNPLNLFQVPFLLLGLWRALVRERRDFQPQAVHAHWIIPQGVIAVLHLLGRRPRPRLVVTSLGADIFGLRRLTWLKRWTLARADAVTGLSEAICTEIRDSVRLPTRVPLRRIPLGVFTERFHPDRRDPALRERLGEGGEILLFVGRLAEKKGVRYLIEAMPAVRREFPRAVLWVAGFGEEEAALRARAEALGLLDRGIRFLGRINHDEAPAYYASADIFVGPSIVAAGGDTEGLGLVFAEAQAAGCAVVASDLPAVRDIVTHGETGCFAAQRDPAALAEQILGLLRDPERRARIAAAGRASALARFDWPTVARQYLAELVPAP
jgi:glycosyltransferase involved in cell wall biosynthesis